MKKTILSLVLCSFALFANQIANAAQTQEIKKEAGYISLNKTATKEVEPNIARITFAVENTANDVQKATMDNATVSNVIVNAIKPILTNERDTIKTSNFSVNPVYATQGGKRVIKNYTAVNSVTIETRDISLVSKLIDTAIASGANRVNGLNYGFEAEKEVCAQMYPDVIKELKSQAGTIAQAAGTSLDGLKHINASCSVDSVVTNTRLYAKGVMEDSASASVSTPVEAGKVKIRVYVNADFYVK